MANCSTLRELFHEKSAQNNGRKNKVKFFFQKVNASYLRNPYPCPPTPTPEKFPTPTPKNLIRY